MTGVACQRTAAELVLLAVMCATACSAEPAPAKQQDYRALVYTEAFRTRFSLPASGVRTLEPGLQAMTIRLLHSPQVGWASFVDVYVDASLAFDYPEGDAGRLEDVQPYGRMFFARQLRDADLKFIAERWHKPRFVYRSKNYDERATRGVLERAGIVGYDRAIAPGLGVITLAIPPRVLDPDHGPAQLYLLRAGESATTLAGTTPNPEQTYLFSVPGSLLRHAANATRTASRTLAHGRAEPRLPEYSLPPR